jgi:caffeoyl-CoA O-methyltransferase
MAKSTSTKSTASSDKSTPMPKSKAPKRVTTATFSEEPRHDWNSEKEVGVFLASLIRLTKARTVLEVGVFEGETSKHIIEALPQGGLYTGIDINDYRKNWKEPDGKVVSFLIGDSLALLPTLPDYHYDIIFIDGDHSWEHVLSEFKKCERLVARNGIIALHDTIHLEGPRKLVEYAAHYGYKNITLNTPEVRGLSLLSRSF